MGAAKTLLIVYHSLTGGTRQMAEAACAGAVAEAGCAVRLLHAAQAFRCWREVVDGADQQRRGQQRTGLGVTGQAHQQGVLVVAFKQHLPAFVQQVLLGG